ncbi:MAG: formylglycine-generating enzyme family protein [Nitrospinales bacterium]
MVRVPEGPFLMGFDIENEEAWGDEDEEPVHEVYLSAYWIDRYEVTAAAFARFLNANKAAARRYIRLGPAVTVEKVNGDYRARPGLQRYPANRVSWYGAAAFCAAQGKRLPTEAEWEKAARGADQRIFPWGNEFPTAERATFRLRFPVLKFRAMSPVDGLPAGRSPYGLHHMAGNVWEWVADWYADDYYRVSPRKDPQGPVTGQSRVMRGGNWHFKAYYMRTTYRFNDEPDSFKIWQGFRCAKTM